MAMDVVRIIVLGSVQGLTEFLPISSSGHLVLVPYFFGWQSPSVFFDVLLHLGTLGAVVCFFWRDILKLARALILSIKELSLKQDPYRKLAWLIVIATMPAAAAGFLFKGFFEKFFSKPQLVALLLLVTGILLVFGEILGRKIVDKRDLEKISLRDSLLVGIFQIGAILPGVSRSGITIVAGLASGLNREEAARFAFLLSVPIVAGAAAEKIKDVVKGGSSFSPAFLIGGFVAFVVGYLAIKYFLKYLRSHKLYVFAGYCWVLGLFFLVVNYWRR